MGAISTELNYKGFIDADIINVKFNGTLYENLPKRIISETENAYGNVNDGLFPFELHSNTSLVNVLTSRNQLGSIEVSIPGKSEVNVDECFKKAVESVAGFHCAETSTSIFDGSVTTVQDGNIAYSELAYAEQITADTITVTFNGTEYECAFIDNGYGAPWNDSTESFDWSEYPFSIGSGVPNQIATETAGTYSVKIEAVESSVETTECFNKAVLSVSSSVLDVMKGFTYDEVYDALKSGKLIYLASPPIDGYTEFWPVVATGVDHKIGSYYVKALRYSSISDTAPSTLTFKADSQTDIMTTN